MAEFDDKLNSLLSNPEAMDQIMKMAQSLMGTAGRHRRALRLPLPAGQRRRADRRRREHGIRPRTAFSRLLQSGPANAGPPPGAGLDAAWQPFRRRLGNTAPRRSTGIRRSRAGPQLSLRAGKHRSENHRLPPAGPPGAGRGPEQQRPPAFIRTAALSETGAAG